MTITETLKRKSKVYIPTTQELNNIIINIYLYKIKSFTYYWRKDTFLYCYDYILKITRALKTKIKNKYYDFTLQELIKYIDKSIKVSIDNEALSIFDNEENIKEIDLLQYPTIFYDNFITTNANPIKCYNQLKDFLRDYYFT